MMSIPLYIVSACILIAFAFIAFRIVVRRSYRQRGRLTWFSSALEFFAFVSWGTFTWLDIPYEWPPADLNPILRIFALICIVVGLSVMFILIFRFSWSRALGQKVDSLVQSGLYRITRNPQTVACGIAVIGYALLWPTWHTLGWVVFLCHQDRIPRGSARRIQPCRRVYRGDVRVQYRGTDCSSRNINHRGDRHRTIGKIL